MAYSHLAEVYRARAEECFRRAKMASDPTTGQALEKLAYEMIEAAAGSDAPQRDASAVAVLMHPAPMRR